MANPTYKPGQHCAELLPVHGQGRCGGGPCDIFPGKLVNANGWCKVWVLKPGAKVGCLEPAISAIL